MAPWCRACPDIIDGLFTYQRFCFERYLGYLIALWDNRTVLQHYLYCQFCWDLINTNQLVLNLLLLPKAYDTQCDMSYTMVLNGVLGGDTR